MKTRGSILVVNAGSSSLKFSLFRLDESESLQLAARGQVDGIGSPVPAWGIPANEELMIARHTFARLTGRAT